MLRSEVLFNVETFFRNKFCLKISLYIPLRESADNRREWAGGTVAIFGNWRFGLRQSDWPALLSVSGLTRPSSSLGPSVQPLEQVYIPDLDTLRRCAVF